MADFDPDSLLTAPAPAEASMTIRPGTRKVLDEIRPGTRKVLDEIISPGESGGRYDIKYGGGRFTDFSQHPADYVPITSGPNAGKLSSAAGRFQFIKSTWDKAAKARGLKDFSPASQDAAAAWLAERTYREKTGRDLNDDMLKDDPSLKAGIRRALASQWESLGKPGPRSDKLPSYAGNGIDYTPESLTEHNGRRDRDLVFMSPDDYLKMSPELDADAANSRRARALNADLAKGEPIHTVPSLDVEDGTITDQDGRHRALAAKNAGMDAIPVAVNHGGEKPADVTDMRGNKRPFSFGLISSAEAAEPKFAPPPGWEPLDDVKAASKFEVPKGWTSIDEKPSETPAAPAPQSPPGMFQSAVEGAAAGLGRTALGAEELVGQGLSAVGAKGVGGWLTNDARYGLNEISKEIGPAEAAHPYVTGGSEIVGGAVAPGGIAGRGVRGAIAAGALAGAISPDSGEGGEYLAKKALQVGGGAAAGGILSAAGQKIAAAVAPHLQPLVKPLEDIVNKLTGKSLDATPAAQIIIKKMVQDSAAGGPSAQDMIDLVNATPKKPLTLADVAGENVLQYAGKIARAPGESRQIMAKYLNDRDAAAAGRLIDDVDSRLAGGSAYDVTTALADARRVAAAPKYEAAYARPPIAPEAMAIDGPIGSMLERPSMKKGLGNAARIAAEEGVDPKTLGLTVAPSGDASFTGVPSWRTLDYVKRGLDDVVEESRDPVTKQLVLNTYGRAADSTRTQFRNTLREANPDYAAALDAYSGPSKSMDAVKAGQGFMRARPEEIERRLSEMTPSDREFYKIGAADSLRQAIAKKGVGADEAKAIIKSDYSRSQLRPLFNDEAQYKDFVNSVEAEGRMFGTKYSILGNSRTAARMAEDTNPDVEAFAAGARGLAHAAHGNFLGAGANAVKSITAMMARNDPKLNAEIAKILTSPISEGLLRPPPPAPTNPGLNLLGRVAPFMPQTRNMLSDALRSGSPYAAPGIISAARGIVQPQAPQQ